MHFDLDETEEALRDGIAELCEGRVGGDRVRAADDTGGVDRGLFAELGEAGVLNLRLDEADGGLGLGTTHAAVVFEELGRSLVPGPLVTTHLAAGLVDGAADGATVVARVLDGPVTVDGAERIVTHPGAADRTVAVADDGVWLVDPGDPDPVPRPLDPVTPVAAAPAPERVERLAGPDRAGWWRRQTTVLRAALAVGIAAQTCDDATAYAAEREQFGRPIGEFQSIKHLCADMLTRAEVARAAVHSAAVHLDDPGIGDVGRAVSAAGLLATRAATDNAKADIQIHGGMGFTWEVDAHLYAKRAAALAAGEDADEHAEAVAATL